VTKAIALVSGGLDSILAAAVIREQGIELLGIAFTTPFFSADNALAAAHELPVPLRVVDITQPHLDLVRRPQFGYGKHLNPCIDCHTLMVREAGRLMEIEGAACIITGEVLGQRPMSQNKRGLKIVEEISGYPGRVVRPLSAKLLPETIPEREGLIDRTRLLDIQGRSRKTQLGLAQRYGIVRYSTPAGGCLLTDPGFSRRLRDLFESGRDVALRDIELLKVGRHLRLSPETKVIIGRHAQENEHIVRMSTPDDDLIKVERVPGPVALIPYGGTPDEVKQAAGICVRYSDAPEGTSAPVIWKRGGLEKRFAVPSSPRSLSRELMI